MAPAIRDSGEAKGCPHLPKSDPKCTTAQSPYEMGGMRNNSSSSAARCGHWANTDA